MKDIAIRQVLIVADESIDNSCVMNKAIDALADELEERNLQVTIAESYDEARPIVANNMDIDCILLATDMQLNLDEENKARRLFSLIRQRQSSVPVFLLADHDTTSEAMSPELMADANEFIWIFEDSPMFIAGRIEAAIERFRQQLLPPLMKAIWDYNEENHEYSWAAPGHQGGRGFTKSPAGKKFYDFYGENLFRTDTGIERASIGSLLDHSGAFGECEKNAAKVFGADQSYSVVVGTSGSNRTIMQAALTPGDIAICDRNCHKSIEQGLILSGAVPVYMLPTRNRYGIIGPILRSEMTAAAIKTKVAKVKLPHNDEAMAPYSVVTNCTYDGLCYNSAKVEAELDHSADRIHLDEAWYGYARFNPMYEDHFAMRGDPKDHKGATVFATHSTHKLLNALSQASFIHMRQGRKPINFDRMNQAYMLHATTSPLYAICASNDISVKMMGESGESLTQEVIDEAIDFRQAMARLYRDFTKKGSWFFKPWNAEKVTSSQTGKTYDFADAPHKAAGARPELLAARPRRQLARLQGSGGQLGDARPDQGQHPRPRHGRRRQDARLRRAGAAGFGVHLSGRHRADPDHRLPADVPVLDGHHQGEMVHPDQQPAEIQGVLRPERAGGGSAAATGEGPSGILRQYRNQGFERQDVPVPEGEHAGRPPRRGLQFAAGTGDDAARRLHGNRPRQHRTGPERQAREPRCGEFDHPVSPGDSDDDVRRTVRRRRQPADRLSARSRSVGQAVPRI